MILSISSFEPERNLKLAIDSYHHYLQASKNSDTFLILASPSGDDIDHDYLLELLHHVEKLKLEKVVFLENVQNNDRTLLL